MPHSVYWLGLALFPLLAIYLVDRAEKQKKRQRVSNAVAYILWLWGGMVGLHRLYTRSYKAGAVYVALFVLLLFGNKISRAARNSASDANNKMRDAEFDVEHFQKAVDKGNAGAVESLEAAKQALVDAQEGLAQATLTLDQWAAFVGGMGALILVFLIVDAVLLPGLVRRCAEREADIPEREEFTVMARGPKADPRNAISTPFIRAVEKISGMSGRFVAYWSLIAVFVYYYEVVARYVFNSPTNWAHESMFLMFGMQYLLSGAYALRDDAHVRVDVIYEKFSTRTRIKIDLVTSFFFFVFAVTLLCTGILFASDSIEVFEVSFTEWAIQYWPVKMTIGLGAALLLLQGLAKLVRDVIYLRQLEA
jgi:TRAP-type mannitol/chloroaromatic compound transport system permease small subunit